MEKVYIEEILDCGKKTIDNLHKLNIYTVDDIKKQNYKVYSVHNFNQIFEQYNKYISDNKVIKYTTLPDNLKNVYIHQLPMDNRIKGYIIGMGIETFENLHFLIQRNIIKYKVTEKKYVKILNAYNKILNNNNIIKKVFTDEEFAILRSHACDKISSLSLKNSTYRIILLYFNMNYIYDLAIFIEKYDKIPHIAEDLRNEIIFKIKEYIIDIKNTKKLQKNI